MSDAQSDPPDDVLLYRMVWHPDHRHDGEFTAPAIFPSGDLKGGGNYVSVDRSDLHDLEEARGRASAQQARAKPPTTIREEAWNIELPCGDVRNVTTDGVRPLTVTDKSQGFHLAHCGISNVSGVQSPAYLRELRLKLLKLVTGQHLLLPRREEPDEDKQA